MKLKELIKKPFKRILNKMFLNHIQETEKAIKNLKKELDTAIEKQNNQNYLVEKELFKAFKVLEYKVFQYNDSLNKLLYENELKLYEAANKKKIKKEPLVSIIIPVYNGTNFVDKAIQSALDQTYKNHEIIVVNDGSTDDGKTEKAVLKYGDKVLYFKKENGGVSSALNYGIKKMHGEYFAWLSHDDLFYPNYLEEHINYLNHTDRKDIITYTNFNLIDENDELLLDKTVIANLHISDYKLTKTSHWMCLLQGEINGGSVLIPKKAFIKAGYFNEKERITQEKDMWARMLKYYTFINIPYTVAAIRTHSGQVTQTSQNILVDTKKKILEILENISKEDMIKDYGSTQNFYQYLKKHYENNNLTEIALEIDKKIEQIRRAKNGKK